VVGTGSDLAAAREAAYAGVAAVEFEGAQHRTDIALVASGLDTPPRPSAATRPPKG
jgi:phosphoribosylamine--glycine ligase